MRSSMALTAATSLNSFPQSSTGRFEGRRPPRRRGRWEIAKVLRWDSGITYRCGHSASGAEDPTAGHLPELRRDRVAGRLAVQCVGYRARPHDAASIIAVMDKKQWF